MNTLKILETLQKHQLQRLGQENSAREQMSDDITELMQAHSERRAPLARIGTGIPLDTEEADWYNEGDKAVSYRIVEDLGETSCDLCRFMDRKVLPKDLYKEGVTSPPFHPNCRGKSEVLDRGGNVLYTIGPRYGRNAVGGVGSPTVARLANIPGTPVCATNYLAETRETLRRIALRNEGTSGILYRAMAHISTLCIEGYDVRELANRITQAGGQLDNSIRLYDRANSLLRNFENRGSEHLLNSAHTMARDALNASETAARIADNVFDDAVQAVGDMPPRIVTREEWEAPSGTFRVDNTDRTEIIIHHTAGSEGETVQGIDRWHREGQGWAGIGYHFTIGNNGTIFEGRPLEMIGAHAGGRNVGTIGIAVMGNFYPEGIPSQAQLSSLFRLIDRLKTKMPSIEKVTRHHGQCPGPWFDRFF